VAKPGPKLKIDEHAEARVFGALSVGASLQDVADMLGIDRSTLTRKKASDPEFAQGCIAAEKDGKIKHLKKISSAKQWQASAWFLERKYWQEFGKREHMEHSGTLYVKAPKGVSQDDL
jgi:hypothetical protein